MKVKSFVSEDSPSLVDLLNDLDRQVNKFIEQLQSREDHRFEKQNSSHPVSVKLQSVSDTFIEKSAEGYSITRVIAYYLKKA